MAFRPQSLAKREDLSGKYRGWTIRRVDGLDLGSARTKQMIRENGFVAGKYDGSLEQVVSVAFLVRGDIDIELKLRSSEPKVGRGVAVGSTAFADLRPRVDDGVDHAAIVVEPEPGETRHEFPIANDFTVAGSNLLSSQDPLGFLGKHGITAGDAIVGVWSSMHHNGTVVTDGAFATSDKVLNRNRIKIVAWVVARRDVMAKHASDPFFRRFCPASLVNDLDVVFGQMTPIDLACFDRMERFPPVNLC